MSRSAVAILSTKNLIHNFSVARSLVGDAKIIAMVKANAYGHGLRSVGRRLDGYTDMLGVSSIDEALWLRQVGVKCPILLAQGPYEPSEIETAAEENFHIVLHHPVHISWLKNSRPKSSINLWIKVDTGLGRLGFQIDEVDEVMRQINKIAYINHPIKIMSHFSCSDEKDNPLNAKQIERFEQIVSTYKDLEYALCNSAGIVNFPNHHYHYVRPGLMIYGISPISGDLASNYNLRPVMTVHSSIISVHNRKKGSGVGYNIGYICEEDMPVGIVAFGYGDGYPLKTSDDMYVIIEDAKCKVIGRISMDMLAIDLRPKPNATVGTKVLLWGEGLPIEVIAEHTLGIPWTIITGVQNRVRFEWVD